MQQVVDLEGSPEFQTLGVQLLSISTDAPAQLAAAAQEFGVASPLLSDEGAKVTDAYGASQWAMPSGEPGHTFVLVGIDGTIKWMRDYGAPQNGGLMYVPVEQLLQELEPVLAENE